MPERSEAPPKHDPKLVDFLVDRLELLDPAFAEEFLTAIGASDTHLVIPIKCPWEDDPFEPLSWDDTISAYLTERRKPTP